MRLVPKAMAVGLLGALAGCGGSGAGGGSNGLSGLFHVASLGGEVDSATPKMEAGFGQASADGGASTVTYDLASNVEGTILPAGTETLPARLDPDGTFALLVDDMGGPVDAFRGARSDDGSVVVFGSVRTGMRPALFTQVRHPDAPAGNADLAGSYHIVVLRHEAQITGLVGTATFDGAGVGSIAGSGVINQQGVVSPLVFPIPMTYAIAADGGATLTTLSSEFHGGLRQGGDLMLVAGGTQAASQVTLFAFLRAPTSASLATLDGDYAIVSLEFDAGVNAFTSVSGTAHADGAGTFSYTGTRNTEGTIGAQGGGGPYTVAADGTLTFNSLGGGVSADGRFAILGDVLAGSAPSIVLLVRR